MSKSLQSLGAFGVVLISSIVAGLLLLQNDLEACTTATPNIIAGGCTIHWALIGAAIMTALISGTVHYLSTVISEHNTQIASLQTATGTVPPSQAAAVAQTPAPVVEEALLPAASIAKAPPAVVPPTVPTLLKESPPS